MASNKHYSELENFLTAHSPDVSDEQAEWAAAVGSANKKGSGESAAKVGGAGDSGTRPGKGAADSATRPGGQGADSGKRPGGNGSQLTKKIEEDQEAGGFVSQTSASVSSQELVDMGDLNMLELLAEQQGMEYLDLGKVHIEEDAIKLFNADFARDNKVLPVRIKADGSLVVAISDPLNVTIVDNLRLLLEKEIVPVVSKEEDIVDLIDTHFSHAEDIDELMEQLEEEGALGEGGTFTEFNLDPEEAAHAPPVIRLVNLILMRALKDRASDLHIEPFASVLRIRYRVDGVLRELPPPPKSFQVGMITRFKVMAGMNITESRRPQDGRIKLTTQGREVDLRVSSLPTIHGESIVMRVLDKQVMMIGIEQIGMTKKVLEVFRKICTRPNGVVLVTGPTGSGKTTTLYAAVTDRLNPDEKFITTEDPVEYEVPGLVQVNINSKVGLTFGACLRAILRQDPDVILVGEIRDVETATISIQAALTGHLVFSTLHTNSAAATVTRLIDMGIEPFLLTSTLQVVIGQRLVRSICQSCREVYEPEEEELAEFAVKPSDVEGITFYHGAGCEECNYSGYRGRLGLFEMMAIDDEIRDMILERATADEVHERAVNLGMMTMRQDGFLKVCMGVTTFSEVSHHVAPETEEAIRREIEPLIKTLRQKLAGIENTSGEQKALPDPEEEPLIPETPSADFLLQTPEALSVDSDSELEALIGSVNKIPGDSQWGLDALPAEGIETPPELGEPADADNLDEVLETDSEDDSLQGLPMPDSLPDSIPGEESKE